LAPATTRTGRQFPRAGAGPENLAARYRTVTLLLEDEVLETLGEGMALRLPEGGGALPTRASTVLKSATWLAWHATACSALQTPDRDPIGAQYDRRASIPAGRTASFVEGARRDL